MKNLKSPFICCIQKAIPLSYDQSLSYYETLCALINYIKEIMTPLTNELIDKVQELEAYMRDYFENLDVQEEINNKLDEMAESGELADIIAQYIQLQGMLCYNTIQDMKNAENLVAGSFAMTYGFYSIGDNGNAKYKVREVTNVDVIDEITLFALHDENLVAELIKENIMNCKQFGCVGDGETDDSERLQKFFNTQIDKHMIVDGSYLIDANLMINSYTTLEFTDNATLIRKPTSAEGYKMLDVVNKEYVSIINAHLIGDKDNHIGETGEWGYGIAIEASQHVNILNSVIEKTWGDGIYVGYTYSTQNEQITNYITLENCKAINCSRNGFSVCSGENIIVSNCYAYGTTRTWPKAGMDIEPEGPDGADIYLKNVNVDNFTTDSNTIGIVINATNGDVENINITEHNSYNEDIGVQSNVTSKGSIVYENAHINKCNNYGVSITKTNESYMVVRNIVVDSTRKSDNISNWEGAVVVIVNSNNDGNLIIDNVKQTNSYNLYKFNDLICVRGTGVCKNLTLQNLIIPNSEYIHLNVIEISSCEIQNVKALSKTNYYEVTIGKDYRNDVIINTPNVETIRKFNEYLPNGKYNIMFDANTTGYNVKVQFANTLTVYSTTAHTTASNNYRSNYRSGYMTFIKNGNVITITNSSFSVDS